MKNILFIALVTSMHSASLFASTAWDNPPILCPEEILASGLSCPNFSQVENPYTDFPDEMGPEEITDWKNNKAADLRLCRSKEVLRRENIKKGSFSPATIELAWMTVDGAKQVDDKLSAIEAAAQKYEIPPQILIGAMKQESLMASLGISPDGGNFSCGMSQLNIQEWCQSMKSLSKDDLAKYGWPTGLSCDSENLPTNIVKSFYDIAIKNLGARHSYELAAGDFKGITFDQVAGNFPDGNNELQTKRFQAIASFVNNCQNVSLSIDFKAQTLRKLFDHFVPEKLKETELYSAGKSFPRACRNSYTSSFFPLHTGWLMAVAMYNAGPVQAKLVGHYFQVKDNQFPTMNPLDLIEALHWGGKYQSETNRIVFKDQAGNKLSQRWFKSCIVQRHVAKVIQHVTLPAESIAKSLEQAPCTPSGVPEYRQKSSGIKKK